LSIKKKADKDYILQCCARTPDECFGKDPLDCDCFHYSKLQEYLEINNLEAAAEETELSVKLFKLKHPEIAPPNGMHDLVEIKRKILSKIDWIKWVNDQISEAEKVEDFGNAAWIAFTLAETYSQSEFWGVSSRFFDRLAAKFRINLDQQGYWEKENRNKRIIEAEIMSLDTLSEISTPQDKSVLLRRAGDKQHELFKVSGDPITHKNFLLEARCFESYALAEPKQAPEYYKKASDVLLVNLDKIQYIREKIYYEGHGKFFLGLYYLSLANATEDEERINLLEKSAQAFDVAIDLSKKVNLDASGVMVIVNCIRAIICVESFPKSGNFKLIGEATKRLEEAKEAAHFQKNAVETIQALLTAYRQALLAVERPKEAIWLISQARKSFDEFCELLPSLRIREAPITNILTSQKYFLKEYIDALAKHAPSYAGKALSFNIICAALTEFKDLVENQLYHAFELTPQRLEETGRSLVQALFCNSFPDKSHQFREVPAAEGRSDILLILGTEKFPFEIKLWRGAEYYNKGLEQIKYYMDKETVDFGFYVIFDHRLNNFRSDSETIVYGSKKIYQIFIHITNKKPV